jgi:hypothetical protein
LEPLSLYYTTSSLSRSKVNLTFPFPKYFARSGKSQFMLWRLESAETNLLHVGHLLETSIGETLFRSPIISRTEDLPQLLGPISMLSLAVRPA